MLIKGRELQFPSYWRKVTVMVEHNMSQPGTLKMSHTLIIRKSHICLMTLISC